MVIQPLVKLHAKKIERTSLEVNIIDFLASLATTSNAKIKELPKQ